MRVGTFFAAAVLLVTSVFAVEVGEYRPFLIHRRCELIFVLSFFFSIAPMDEVEVEEMDTQPDPEVLVVASFPESNPFGRTCSCSVRLPAFLNILDGSLKMSSMASETRCG